MAADRPRRSMRPTELSPTRSSWTSTPGASPSKARSSADERAATASTAPDRIHQDQGRLERPRGGADDLGQPHAPTRLRR